MGEALNIRPQKPTSLPRASSRRQRPCVPNISKRLFFENPAQTLLINALGERFTLKVARLYSGGYDLELKSKDRGAGELRINIGIRTYKEKNKVCISSITCWTPETPETLYSKPSKENRGFGIVRLAIHVAKKIAKEQDVSRITIQPYCRELQAHYLSSGFREEPISDTIKRHELVMHLKK
ncbi:MAG: hypothetical protein GY852_04605 [bacterium]|nr:hypothetical protein [bacterium]